MHQNYFNDYEIYYQKRILLLVFEMMKYFNKYEV